MKLAVHYSRIEIALVCSERSGRVCMSESGQQTSAAMSAALFARWRRVFVSIRRPISLKGLSS